MLGVRAVTEVVSAATSRGHGVEAARRACGAGPDTVVEIVAELPPGTDLRDGEVLLR
jgi:histone acetyltransferase (RNA polymerase elongator complex component)